MGKTKKTKRETKKRKKTQRGGRPKFIKMYAQYTEDGNVIYRFVNDEFDKDDQKKIAERDRVYYSVKNDKSLMDELKNQVGVLNEEVRSFFYKNPKNEKWKTDKKIIIIRNEKELEQIQIAQKIIKNMKSIPLMEDHFNNMKLITDIPQFINYHKKLIEQYKNILFNGIDDKSIAEQLLNTSTFIIGMHYNFINNQLNLDELKQELDLDRENAEKERLDREKAEKDRIDREKKTRLEQIATNKRNKENKQQLVNIINDKIKKIGNGIGDKIKKIGNGIGDRIKKIVPNKDSLRTSVKADNDRLDEYDPIKEGNQI